MKLMKLCDEVGDEADEAVCVRFKSWIESLNHGLKVLFRARA
jgi:hypothetical protein